MRRLFPQPTWKEESGLGLIGGAFDRKGQGKKVLGERLYMEEDGRGRYIKITVSQPGDPVGESVKTMLGGRGVGQQKRGQE